MSESDAPSDPAAVAVAAAEWWLIGALLLTGIVLRCWQPGHMAVEHFDEGVYASNLYCPPENAYPYRHLYAPPLLPALLEWSLILSGGAASSVMAVNVVVGCLMIPSVWWVGRQWFGPVAGLAAAALASFSEVHILYSRTALTDGLLCFWLLWGVYWAWRAILTGRPAAILLAATFASLAWWTKYNGWLTLAISGSATLAWLIVDRFVTPRFAGHFQCPAKPQAALVRWFALATIAIVGWVPYLLALQPKGGYAAVAENHAGYFVGFAGWWDGLLRQNANLTHIESWWTGLGLIAALVLTVAYPRLLGHQPNEAAMSRRQVMGIIIGCNVGAAVVLGLAILTGGMTSVLIALAVLGTAVALWRTLVGHEPVAGHRLATWLLAAWIVGLLVAVPLYHPYLRLSLPLIVACWLGAGLACSQLCPEWLGMTAAPQPEDESATGGSLLGSALALIAAVAAGLSLQAWRQGAASPPAWDDRGRLQTIASEVLNSLPDHEDQLIYVVGEPALFFQLANQSRSASRAFIPASDLAALAPWDDDQRPIAIYALQGPHSQRTPSDPAAGISWAEANATLIAEWPYEPSTLVRLNQHSPEQIAAGLEPEQIRLLRIGD